MQLCLQSGEIFRQCLRVWCPLVVAKAESDDHAHHQRHRCEYSDTGDNRRKGSVVMLGKDVVVFNVGLREPNVVPFRDRRA